MREIKCEDITKTVKQLCMEAACNLPSDVFKALKDKTDTEPYPLAKKTLEVLIDNADLAKDNMMPICQDTGMALSLIHISEPTRQAEISYAVFCLKKKKQSQRERQKYRMKDYG